MPSFFITGSGTGVGKTLVMTILCWQLRQSGKTVTALKPVITGYNPEDAGNDAALILKSCGLVSSPALMATIAPWRYRAPLSPSMAAAQEGNPVDVEALAQFCRDHAALESDVVLAEGVGGVMSPLTETQTVLDWMEALGWPVILASGSYLGALSHTLASLEALKSRRIRVQALVVSESEGSPVSLVETAVALEKFLPSALPVVKLPRIGGKGELWKQAPPISWMCE